MRRTAAVAAVTSAVLLLSPGVGSAAEAGIFDLPDTYDVGWAPFSVGQADLDGDSAVDLVVPNHLDGTITILAGRGDGGFKATSTLPVGNKPLEVAAADFNEDGHQDLATANAGGDVGILLGSRNGKVSMAARIPFGGGSRPWSVAAGDFNHDGHVDLATALNGYSKVGLLLGRGDGMFTTLPGLSTNYGQLVGIAVGDFNADGDQDLAVSDHYYSDVVVFLGNGDGTFGEWQRHGVGIRPTNLVVADLNEDGYSDLATASDMSFTEQVSLLIGNGDGSFQSVRYVSLSRHNAKAIAVTSGDFNGDCHVDLATADGGAMVSVLLGDGLGNFHDAESFQAGKAPYLLTAGDFNGDGLSDLAIPNQNDYPGTISVALATGSTPCGE